MNDDVVVDHLDLLDAGIEARRSLDEQAARDGCDRNASSAQHDRGGDCVGDSESTFQGETLSVIVLQ
jgi:hypothetical protein